jgi:hypothetical protein
VLIRSLTTPRFSYEIVVVGEDHTVQSRGAIKKDAVLKLAGVIFLGGEDVNATQSQSVYDRFVDVDIRVESNGHLFWVRSGAFRVGPAQSLLKFGVFEFTAKDLCFIFSTLNVGVELILVIEIVSERRVYLGESEVRVLPAGFLRAVSELVPVDHHVNDSRPGSRNASNSIFVDPNVFVVGRCCFHERAL